jgi:hypothetical protein
MFSLGQKRAGHTWSWSHTRNQLSGHRERSVRWPLSEHSDKRAMSAANDNSQITLDEVSADNATPRFASIVKT